MGIDSQGHIWVSDACNHRLQVFASQGDKVELVTIYGGQGKEIGKFQYPYGLVIDGQDGVWISEFGGHRIQKLDREGKPILSWGQPGRLPGELFNPWAVSILPDGQLLVVDSGNHRVQRVRL
jgi:DNA-binding beta-propeller fold protein YncE